MTSSRPDPSSRNFSAVAAEYDRTRAVPDAVIEGAFRVLVETGHLAPGDAILDVGCGTGQFAVPFFRLGAAVVGVDISSDMLAIAHAKAPDLPLLAADAYDLPFPAGHFSAVVVSKLFQHLREWRRAVDEIRRVTRPGGRLFVIHEHGAFRNQVRRQFERLADDAGFRDRYLGPTDMGVVVDYALTIGGQREEIDTKDLTWTKTVRYGDVLADHEQWLYAEFWPIPDDVYRRMVAQARGWIEEQPDGLDTIEAMQPYLAIDVIRWPT